MGTSPISPEERRWRAILAAGPEAIDAYIREGLESERREVKAKAEAQAARRRADHAAAMRAWRAKKAAKPAHAAPTSRIPTPDRACLSALARSP